MPGPNRVTYPINLSTNIINLFFEKDKTVFDGGNEIRQNLSIYVVIFMFRKPG